MHRRRGHVAAGSILRHSAAAFVEEYAIRRRLLVRVLPNVFPPAPPVQGSNAPASDAGLAGGSGSNPSAPDASAAAVVWADLGFRASPGLAPYRTFRLDLEPSLERLRAQLDQKWRNQLNRAEKNGLTIAEGVGDDLYDQFAALYGELMARKQFETTVDIGQYRRIQQRLPDAQKMRIFICLKEGRPLNAVVASALGDTGIYLLGAMNEEGMKSKGAYLLQWRMIQWFKESGCHWYDLGGINPERNPGVYHFKEGLSGTDLRQLGPLDLCRSPLSAVSVRAGETARRIPAGLARAARALAARFARPASRAQP
jgi:hypothetical protein